MRLNELKSNQAVKSSEVSGEVYEIINEFLRVVRSTYGPAGRLVCFEGPDTIYPTYTKDGVSVARQYRPKGRLDRIITDTIIQAAERQLRDCGDGTTLTIVLACHILIESFKLLGCAGSDRRKLRERIDYVTKKVTAGIKKRAKPITDEYLRQIINVSLNGDKELGDLVYTAVTHCGEYGVIVKEYSPSGQSGVLFDDGYQWDKGISREFFENVPGAFKGKNAMVLVSNDILIHMDDLTSAVRSILEHYAVTLSIPPQHIKADMIPALVVIAPNFERGAMQFAKKLLQDNQMRVIWIQPAGANGTNERLYQMENLAAFTGATPVAGDSNVSLREVEFKHLGRVDMCFSTAAGSSFSGGNQESIEKRIESLKEKKELFRETDPYEVGLIDHSIARLQSKFCRVQVGGKTESEQKEALDRLDDALKSVYSARELGIVAGGGVTLRLQSNKKHDPYDAPVYRAIIEPWKWLTHTQVNEGAMIKRGIIDPAKTVISAVENAASVAKMIIDTEYFILDVD